MINETALNRASVYYSPGKCGKLPGIVPSHQILKQHLVAVKFFYLETIFVHTGK